MKLRVERKGMYPVSDRWMEEEKWKDARDAIDKTLKEDPDKPEFKMTREFIMKQM